MKVAITGASGLVGTALTNSLQQEGHEVTPVVRGEAQPGEILWNPSAGTIDAAALEGIEAVVHLAGESIAEGRWTEEKKKRIRESRVRGTRLISETLAQMENKPAVFVSASAIGYYGDRTGPLDESASPGNDFLAEVCQAWEEATQPAKEAGIRTVNVRIGVVLSERGGALGAMLTPFKLGFGGKVGDGNQVWSWVAIDDLVGAIKHAIDHEAIEGPMNATAPHPSSNAEFTKTLGHVLGRPTIIPLPAFAARLLLGEMADALLLASARVLPKKLLANGYQFKFEHLEPALRALLK